MAAAKASSVSPYLNRLFLAIPTNSVFPSQVRGSRLPGNFAQHFKRAFEAEGIKFGFILCDDDYVSLDILTIVDDKRGMRFLSQFQKCLS